MTASARDKQRRCARGGRSAYGIAHCRFLRLPAPTPPTLHAHALSALLALPENLTANPSLHRPSLFVSEPSLVIACGARHTLHPLMNHVAGSLNLALACGGSRFGEHKN